MPYENLGAAPLLTMLAKLLAQAAATLEKLPDHSPEQATSLANMRGIAARAEFLALQIGGNI